VCLVLSGFVLDVVPSALVERPTLAGDPVVVPTARPAGAWTADGLSTVGVPPIAITATVALQTCAATAALSGAASFRC
jgi:hypothetical protein